MVFLFVVLTLQWSTAYGTPLQASQTFSTYRTASVGDTPGETMVAYTALGTTGAIWRVRAAVSWWNWQPDGETGLAGDSGLGAVHLTLGYGLWRSSGDRSSSRGWAQVKGAIPLGNTPSPAGSGEFDWGMSLLTTNRLGEFLVFGEAGYLDPGDPVGVTYNSQFSGTVSASWHHRGFRVYPVASFVAAGPVIDGAESYSEWSAGLGALLGRRTGILALYSHGTNSWSPGRGLTAVLTLRL